MTAFIIGAMQRQGLKTCAGIGLAILAFSTFAGTAFGQDFEFAMTQEGVRKKAVITQPEVKVFKSSRGSNGEDEEFMKVLFLFEGEENGRIPAAFDSQTDKPNAWLEKNTYMEWNSIQMVDFAPQSGRKLAKVYSEADCALQFARNGQNLACEQLGEEPERAQGSARYRMLVPVFESQTDKDVIAYRGGFVRVTGDQVIKAVDPTVTEPPTTSTGNKSTTETSGDDPFGYDLILVIDSTASMGTYFPPTVEAVKDFVSYLGGNVLSGEVSEPLRIGLLFYQDRKQGADCNLDYITKWRVQLSDAVGSEAVKQTIDALSVESATECDSDEPAEAVLDALNRALTDTEWKDGAMAVVALIGNAGPHPKNNTQKNPLALDVPAIQKIADERTVRIMSFRLANPGENTSEFQDLALGRTEAGLRGRHKVIQTTTATAAGLNQLTQQIASDLRTEWNDLIEPIRAARAAKLTKSDVQGDASARSRINAKAYAIPTIVMYLPDDYAGDARDDFALGWVPQKVIGKNVVNEFLFMDFFKARQLLRFMEDMGDRFSNSDSSGPEVFVESLRESMAEMLRQNPDELFESGDTVFDILMKADLLPFDTGLLSFTEEDLLTMRGEDYDRIAKILIEKSDQMRDFVDSPVNIKLYGASKYVYVPKQLFP